MGKVSIRYEDALSEIQQQRAAVQGTIQQMGQQLGQLQGILAESSGEFTEALKNQFKVQQTSVAASCELYEELCNAIEEGAKAFHEQDQKISASMKGIQ